MKRQPNTSNTRQDGSVLVITLLLLLLMTFLGLQATTTSNLEMQLAVNDNDYRRLLNAAESGLSDAIEQLQNGFMSGNQLALATNGTPTFTFALAASGHQGGMKNAAAGTEYTAGRLFLTGVPVDSSLGSNSETYDVYIWNNLDGGSATVDDDALIWVLAESTGPRGGSARVAVLLQGGMSSQFVGGYAAQEGGGSGKNYNAQDVNAVSVNTSNAPISF